MIQWKKYILVFFITAGIFILAFALSNYLNGKKVSQIENIQDKISVDILSLETQFSLLQNVSCEYIGDSFMSAELNSLAQKIEFSEENINRKEELDQLKKIYSLLEIKDYLLAKKINERCKIKNPSILYFYTKADYCSFCVEQGYVLTALREKYPDLRVYSFDYGLDLSALKALITVYKIDDKKLPALVINEKVYTGFNSIEEIEKIVGLEDPIKVELKKEVKK